MYAILKCTSSYPSMDKDLNLKTMAEIKKKFGCLSGFSDHTLGIDTAVHSASLGASMLEKHVKPNGAKTVDSFFSINIKMLKRMIERIRSNERANGTISFKIANSSKKNMNGRRSIYVIKNIKKGENFTFENIKSIRPSYGLHPKYLEKFLGKKALFSIKKGMRLKWNMLKKK